jgi:integrase/recombinase XerD
VSSSLRILVSRARQRLQLLLAQVLDAYRLEVRHFMRALGITSTDMLRQVDHRAVIAWEGMQREVEKAEPSTIRRRLAALSSLFKHLVRHGAAARNPVVDIERPTINRDEGSVAAFSKAQARKILDAPAADTLAGLRDRAILYVGLQVGFRRAEIAALDVGDLHENRGFDALRVTRKGGRREALAVLSLAEGWQLEVWTEVPSRQVQESRSPRPASHGWHDPTGS